MTYHRKAKTSRTCSPSLENKWSWSIVIMIILFKQINKGEISSLAHQSLSFFSGFFVILFIWTRWRKISSIYHFDVLHVVRKIILIRKILPLIIQNKKKIQIKAHAQRGTILFHLEEISLTTYLNRVLMNY